MKIIPKIYRIGIPAGIVLKSVSKSGPTRHNFRYSFEKYPETYTEINILLMVQEQNYTEFGILWVV